MINSVTGSGSVMVSNGYVSFPTFTMNYNNPLTGALRYNSSSYSVEVFDGTSWAMMNKVTPVICLDAVAEKAISWAAKKMEDEAFIFGLSKEYPAVKDLLDEQADIKLKIDMVIALVKQEVKA